MGGEGAAWIGQSPFTEENHVFANIGDGTYFHSGYMAIRAAVAAGVNITYKILFNDAVAMTGGQPVEGPLTVPQISRQLAAEGVARIVVVTDEPEKHAGVEGFRAGRHRASSPRAARRSSASCATSPAPPSSSTTRPAPRKSAGGASAARSPIRRSACSSTRRCAKVAATVRDIELPVGAAAGNPVRHQAPHRPVELQQGFLLHRGFLPELRHRAWRHARSAAR